MKINGYKKKVLLSDGRIIDKLAYRPFEYRDNLKKLAGNVSDKLKYTKKQFKKQHNTTEFNEFWLNNPDVVFYRELLKSIWEFVPSLKIIKTVDYSCYECGTVESKSWYLAESDTDIESIKYNIHCQHCKDKSQSDYFIPDYYKYYSVDSEYAKNILKQHDQE